jgi:tRNA(Ile)-lysidine synthase
LLSGGRQIELNRLRDLPPSLARLVVQRLAAGAARRTEEIAALREHGSAVLDIGHGIRAVAEYGVLRFEREEPGPPPEPVLLAIPGTATFGAYEVRCELGPPGAGPGALDRAALGSDLLVRSWRPGDRMSPVGLHGSKSLQDLFTARRVPRARRAGVPVVESAGEIVWVAGVATSERAKVCETTVEAARLSVSETQPPAGVKPAL